MTHPDRQTGLVLASVLMLFAVVSLSMGTVLGIATRELARTSIHESLTATAQSAGMALAEAVAADNLDDTTATVVHEGAMQDGTRYSVNRRYLGATDRADDDSLADWHFLFTVNASSRNGAEVIEQLQLRIAAPAPVDPAHCLEHGCPVPPLCAPPACDPPLRAAAEQVAWHLPETPP